jgi:hypothetical protein
MMVENPQTIPTDGHHQTEKAEKKEKNGTKSKTKRSKSEGKQKSSKNLGTDKGKPSSEFKIQVEFKKSSREGKDRADSVEFIDDMDDPKKDLSSKSLKSLKKTPSRQRKLSRNRESVCSKRLSFRGKIHSPYQSPFLHCINDLGSSKKGKKSSRKSSSEKRGSSDDSFVNSDGEHKEKVRSSRSLKSTRSRDSRKESDSSSLQKEDKKPSLPRRASDVSESDGVEKSTSSRKVRKNSKQKEEIDEDGVLEDAEDKQPTKSKRKTTRRVSPDSQDNDGDNDNESGLNVGSFHSLRKDSDKPSSRSKSGRRRTPTSGRSRNKTPTGGVGGRMNRRRIKDKASCNSGHIPVSNDDVEDDMDGTGTQEIDLKDDDTYGSGSNRSRRERRKERLLSNEGIREARKSGRSSRMRRSHSERWNRAVESLDGEGVEHPQVVRRRAHDSLNRANDGLSRSAHSKVRRHNSSGLSRMTGSLNSRSYHGMDNDRRASGEGRRTPKRIIRPRRHQTPESANSAGDDSIDSFDDGRSQATLESIDDFEDFGEDFYGMELQTPGMVDFEEEMLDLMQRANPEVTDHLDRRVHRKRAMVEYDHDMPMMTRQALLTRQASSQLQRQFFDGSNIDKKRLLLRNDSMQSNNSAHRVMRSGRRAPPRAKSSGLGAMGRGGYMDSMGGPDSDDRRRVFRTGRSTQTASFNQYYSNKPNKVRTLSRGASGDLVQGHGLRLGSSGHRRRPVQRASSTTALRRSNSSDHVAPRKPQRKSSDDDSYHDGELESEERSISLRGSSLNGKTSDKNDMGNKRNRSKLHLLMYMTKMSVDMDDLLQKVKDGETPRAPIDTLRMPSP